MTLTFLKCCDTLLLKLKRKRSDEESNQEEILQRIPIEISSLKAERER